MANEKESFVRQQILLTCRLARATPRKLVSLFTAITLSLILITCFSLQDPQSPMPLAFRRLTKIKFPGDGNSSSRDQQFVIVVPADSSSPDLCKLVTSAIALGYPAPIIVNWAKDFHKNDDGFGASHLGKITGTLEYLDSMVRKDANKGDRLDEHDLVLVVDAYDIWFQLPPELLLRRYHDTNQRANERLAEQWGHTEDVPMRQTIIISTQKRCWPPLKSGSDQHCDALPESTLRPDLYGSNTDIKQKKTHHNIRPRYVNSGSIMGPAGDMRRYFRRAKQVMEKGLAQGTSLWSDQGILGEVLGEQEIWRKWRRDLHSSLQNDLPDDEGTALMQSSNEFHVGLDYSQGLFLPTVYEENDGIFISLNNQSAIAEKSQELKISPVRLQGVPEDVTECHSPLAEIIPDDSTYGWGDMPLYTDFFTTATPVILHHNAWEDGLKERRVSWWDQTWYFPHLRSLVELRLRPSKLKVLAQIPVGNNLVSYWPIQSESQKRRPRLFEVDRVKDGLQETEFGTVCKYPDETEESEKRWYNEVFRDNGGPL
ncbi:hypothetical protein G7046_g3972 [Stylonectria norvegica]|nr:hypothetical protein G7046_g3972 [Stylonectria norvegica]